MDTRNMSLDEQHNEECRLPSSSMINVLSSKNKHAYTASATNRILPPPHLTINQFQPVFKDVRKNKQELNTKNIDGRKNLDQTLFKAQLDNNASECIFSEPKNNRKFKDENHYVCSSTYVGGGSIMCNIMTQHQSNTSFENEKTDAIFDHADNLSFSTQMTNQDNVREDYCEIKISEPKINVVVAQKDPDSNQIQSVIVPGNRLCTKSGDQEVLQLNPTSTINNVLLGDNDSPPRYKETFVSLHGVKEKKISKNGEKFSKPKNLFKIGLCIRNTNIIFLIFFS